MKIIAISDSHCQNLLTKWDIPDGEVLIHAGDITAIGDEKQIIKQARQLDRLRQGRSYKRIFFVPGNHDKLFANNRGLACNIFADYGIRTLIDEEDILETQYGPLGIYGTPWVQLQPGDLLKLSPDALAFSRMDCREPYSKIPTSTHVLVTHQPPSGILDTTDRGESIGSPQLSSTIQSRLGVMSHPIAFIFGHNHAGYGYVDPAGTGGRRFYNVALCDERYRPVNQPTIIDL